MGTIYYLNASNSNEILDILKYHLMQCEYTIDMCNNQISNNIKLIESTRDTSTHLNTLIKHAKTIEYTKQFVRMLHDLPNIQDLEMEIMHAENYKHFLIHTCYLINKNIEYYKSIN